MSGSFYSVAATQIILLVVLVPYSFCTPLHEVPASPSPSASSLPAENHFDWSYGQTAERTFIFSHCHWWESTDHQMTTIITLLTIAENTSSIAVIPPLPSSSTQQTSNKSLLGDYFDLEEIRKVQPVMTMAQFMESSDYRTLKSAPSGTLIFPKDSQEEYESRFHLLGTLRTSTVAMGMPPIDPENTNQPCNRFAGTMHLSSDGKTRFVFLDRLHFLHFCTEQFMPWWYDVRLRIAPRPALSRVAARFAQGVTRPLAVVHINDVMETQTVRDEADIERYAREIVDGLRVADSLRGTLYLIYARNGRNVRRVADLLRQEFEGVRDCRDVWRCLADVRLATFDPPLVRTEGEADELYGTTDKPSSPDGMPVRVMEWALGTMADIFVGNIHSPYSRNVCLYRKTHGKPYSVVRGFAEMRKIWKWNL